jgi:hypothetical protein
LSAFEGLSLAMAVGAEHDALGNLSSESMLSPVLGPNIADVEQLGRLIEVMKLQDIRVGVATVGADLLEAPE